MYMCMIDLLLCTCAYSLLFMMCVWVFLFICQCPYLLAHTRRSMYKYLEFNYSTISHCVYLEGERYTKTFFQNGYRAFTDIHVVEIASCNRNGLYGGQCNGLWTDFIVSGFLHKTHFLVKFRSCFWDLKLYTKMNIKHVCM